MRRQSTTAASQWLRSFALPARRCVPKPSQTRSLTTRTPLPSHSPPVRPTLPPVRSTLSPCLPPIRQKSTVDQAKSRYRNGPFSWKAGVLFVATSAALIWYFEHEKKRMHLRRIAEANKGAGKPKVGGPFELIDHNGQRFTHENLQGRFSLVYFGFTHCPDICPEELDKLAEMLDIVAEKGKPDSVLPVFITCDPARDGPRELKEYLAEFHPSLIGLTGSYDQIKDVCKAYRVYFSTPQKVAPGQDYLVDHSIYFYLMDPDGHFVEALGRQHSPHAAAQLILDHMREHERSHPPVQT